MSCVSTLPTIFLRPVSRMTLSPVLGGTAASERECPISGAKVFSGFTPPQWLREVRPKIFLFPCGRAYLSAVPLRRLNPTPYKLPKLEHSSPAPKRHGVKKKVENHDTDSKKQKTANFLPSDRHGGGDEDSEGGGMDNRGRADLRPRAIRNRRHRGVARLQSDTARDTALRPRPCTRVHGDSNHFHRGNNLTRNIIRYGNES